MKSLELTLIKNENGMIVANQDELTIAHFDNTEEARREFMVYLLEEFINREVE